MNGGKIMEVNIKQIVLCISKTNSLLLSIIILYGCVTTGGVPIIDDFNRSPEAQRLMNEAVDNFVEKLNVQSIEGKSVKLMSRGSGPSTRFTGKDVEVKSYDFSESMSTAMSGVGWSGYLIAALERKVLSHSGKCLEKNVDTQIVVNVDAAGLRRRVFYVPFIPFFVIDIYQHRTYWATFDTTVDFRTAKGMQILETQRIGTESSKLQKPCFFRQSAALF